MADQHLISVVVPTRDRPAPLARCLDALARQVGAEPEIVVVDDGSADPTSVRAVAERYPRTRIVRLEGRGPAAARNAGVQAASGTILLLTDDDCIPDPAWVRTLAESLSRDDVDAAGGLTVSPRGASAIVRATEVVIRHVEEHAGLLATANLGCRRQLFLDFPFDESFPLAAGEDRDWTARVRAGGRQVVRERSALVVHAPALDLRRFWRQHVRYGMAARTLMSRGTSRFQRPTFYRDLVRTGFREGPLVGVFVLVAQVATAIGYVRAGRR